MVCYGGIFWWYVMVVWYYGVVLLSGTVVQQGGIQSYGHGLIMVLCWTGGKIGGMVFVMDPVW